MVEIDFDVLKRIYFMARMQPASDIPGDFPFMTDFDAVEKAMGIEVEMDGDKYFARFSNTFQNLQESPCGFGDNRELAITALLLSE